LTIKRFGGKGKKVDGGNSGESDKGLPRKRGKIRLKKVGKDLTKIIFFATFFYYGHRGG